jgi:hypothetical protein
MAKTSRRWQHWIQAATIRSSAPMSRPCWTMHGCGLPSREQPLEARTSPRLRANYPVTWGERLSSMTFRGPGRTDRVMAGQPRASQSSRLLRGPAGSQKCGPTHRDGPRVIPTAFLMAGAWVVASSSLASCAASAPLRLPMAVGWASVCSLRMLHDWKQRECDSGASVLHALSNDGVAAGGGEPGPIASGQHQGLPPAQWFTPVLCTSGFD